MKVTEATITFNVEIEASERPHKALASIAAAAQTAMEANIEFGDTYVVSYDHVVTGGEERT